MQNSLDAPSKLSPIVSKAPSGGTKFHDRHSQQTRSSLRPKTIKLQGM